MFAVVEMTPLMWIVGIAVGFVLFVGKEAPLRKAWTAFNASSVATVATPTPSVPVPPTATQSHGGSLFKRPKPPSDNAQPDKIAPDPHTWPAYIVDSKHSQMLLSLGNYAASCGNADLKAKTFALMPAYAELQIPETEERLLVEAVE